MPWRRHLRKFIENLLKTRSKGFSVMVWPDKVRWSLLCVFSYGIGKDDEVTTWLNEFVHLLAPVYTHSRGDCDEEAGINILVDEAPNRGRDCYTDVWS